MSPLSARFCGPELIAAEAQDDRGRPGEELDVPPERPVRDVEVVEPDHLVEPDLIAAEHLPGARDPGREIETPACPPVVRVALQAKDGTGPPELKLPAKQF